MPLDGSLAHGVHESEVLLREIFSPKEGRLMCETLKLPGGGFAILCGGRHRKPPKCRWCDSPSTKLCDFRNSDGRTCDGPMCDAHAKSVGRNLDYCPLHAKHALELFNPSTGAQR